MLFKIDLNRLVLQLLPTFYRQPLIFGIMRAALGRLNDVYQSFTNARTAHLYRLSHNGQVCYLRAVLNDHFKSQHGKFDILTIEREGSWLYAITEAGQRIPLAAPEDKTDAAGQYVDDGVPVPVLYNEIALNAAQNAFVVSVPADLYQTTLSEIVALVNEYKLISKNAIYMAQS